jgi:enoyl-CoA hydratase/carnithine racemase
MDQPPADEAESARVVVHDGWGELVLSRVHRRNALTGPMAAGLRAGLAELLAGGAKTILLRGDGGAFCSGLDVDAFAATPAPAWRATWPKDWADFHRELYQCPAVIVGALERFAINGGASLALACDLLVVGEGAYLMVGEAAIGMQAPMNVAWLRLRTTEVIAARVCLGAGRMTGPDLHGLGLAYKVVADVEVDVEARALAARLAGFPGSGLVAIKAALRRPVPAGGDIFDAVVGGPTSAPPSRIAL